MSDDTQNLEVLGNAALEAAANYYSVLTKLYPERMEEVLVVYNPTGQMLCYAPSSVGSDQLMRLIKQNSDAQ